MNFQANDFHPHETFENLKLIIEAKSGAKAFLRGNLQYSTSNTLGRRGYFQEQGDTSPRSMRERAGVCSVHRFLDLSTQEKHEGQLHSNDARNIGEDGPRRSVKHITHELSKRDQEVEDRDPR